MQQRPLRDETFGIISEPDSNSTGFLPEFPISGGNMTKSDLSGTSGGEEAMNRNRKGEFELPELPYDLGALEPVISHQSLSTHYDVIHRGYVDRLNLALRHNPVEGLGLGSLLDRVARFAPDVEFNGHGHWNHTFLWSLMTDQKEDHEIPLGVQRALESSFGSLETFRYQFVETALSAVGCGWIWLVKGAGERLSFMTTRDEINPLAYRNASGELLGRPILACDLWEHAYFLDYRADRETYIKKFLAIVNWARVQTLMQKVDDFSALH